MESKVIWHPKQNLHNNYKCSWKSYDNCLQRESNQALSKVECITIRNLRNLFIQITSFYIWKQLKYNQTLICLSSTASLISVRCNTTWKKIDTSQSLLAGSQFWSHSVSTSSAFSYSSLLLTKVQANCRKEKAQNLNQ